MDINMMNKAITACRMLDQQLEQEYNTTQPIVHQEVLESVREHRRYFGVIHRYSILRSLVRTRRFCKISGKDKKVLPTSDNDIIQTI